MRRLLILPLALVALAGCGDDEPATTATTEPAPAATAEAPASGDGVTVDMEGLEFAPVEVTVKVGQKITWVNGSGIPHNVVAEEGADFSSETFGEEGKFEFTPEAAGVIQYVCTLHPGMDGKVTVEE